VGTAVISTVVSPNEQTVRARLRDAIAVKQAMLGGQCPAQAVQVAGLIVEALRADGKVIFLGNGGSAMDAGHLSAELMGRFAFDRPSLAALSLPDATAAVTAIGNDYSYSDVFARQVVGIGRRGDVVIGLSTSGNSPNVVRALGRAKDAGLVTVALTGATGGQVAGVVDICIHVPSDDTPRIQEACLHLGHTICEMVEAAMFRPPG
jgi:D-sedoheptulose 7-phosphate isomerase